MNYGDKLCAEMMFLLIAMEEIEDPNLGKEVSFIVLAQESLQLIEEEISAFLDSLIADGTSEKKQFAKELKVIVADSDSFENATEIRVDSALYHNDDAEFCVRYISLFLKYFPNLEGWHRSMEEAQGLSIIFQGIHLLESLHISLNAHPEMNRIFEKLENLSVGNKSQEEIKQIIFLCELNQTFCKSIEKNSLAVIKTENWRSDLKQQSVGAIQKWFRNIDVLYVHTALLKAVGEPQDQDLIDKAIADIQPKIEDLKVWLAQLR